MEENQQQNLVEWQLDFQKELTRIERLLRNQRVKIDEHGIETFEDPPKGEALFNERGVQTVLQEVQWYLNKNLVLSNYDQKTINIRLTQFGDRIRRLIFLNYKEYGLDTDYKMKHYETIVLRLLDAIEAAYNRALRGGERDSLRSARVVNQSQPLGQPPANPYATEPVKRQGSRLNPRNWI